MRLRATSLLPAGLMTVAMPIWAADDLISVRRLTLEAAQEAA